MVLSEFRLSPIASLIESFVAQSTKELCCGKNHSNIGTLDYKPFPMEFVKNRRIRTRTHHTKSILNWQYQTDRKCVEFNDIVVLCVLRPVQPSSNQFSFWWIEVKPFHNCIFGRFNASTSMAVGNSNGIYVYAYASIAFLYERNKNSTTTQNIKW